MRPTRRGYVLAGVVVLAVLSASFFGARGLNAIAAPGVVALAYAGVQVWRTEPPTIDRRLPRRGEQGTSVPVELAFETGRPYSARVVDAPGVGLEATGNAADVTIGGTTMGYELHLRRRGNRTLGPVTVEARDVIGLLSTTYEVDVTDSILVRPAIHSLSGPRADELVGLFGGGDDRQEFDFLRHYRRGDPLRDIHWPSSAKVPGDDLVVKEFGNVEGETSVRIAGESAVGHADEMAAATASIAVHLLAAGLRVALATGDTRLTGQGGTEQRDRVLDALGRSRGGTLRERDRADADILVSAGPDGVTVTLDDADTPFSQVAGREVAVPPRDDAEDGLTERLGGLA